jgi:mono/diheme cytochrome c family protein
MSPLALLVWLAGVPTKIPPDRDRGRELYAINCWPCHGEAALGDGPAMASPPLAGRISASGYDEAVALIQAGKGDMPGFSAVMDKSETRRILVWLAELDPKTGADRGAKKADAKTAPKVPAEPKTPGDEEGAEN